MNRTLLNLLGLVAARQVNLVTDPNMTSLATWSPNPSTILCNQCATDPSVAPSVPGGYYLFVPFSVAKATLATAIALPAHVDSVGFSTMLQVQGETEFTLTATLAGGSWFWSAATLTNYSRGYHLLNQNLTMLPADSDRNETLLLTIESGGASTGFLSINQINVFASRSGADHLSVWPYLAIGGFPLFAILVLGLAQVNCVGRTYAAKANCEDQALLAQDKCEDQALLGKCTRDQ